MEDIKIIALFWDRSEEAITEIAAKYGSFCHSIAYNILASNEDAQECVNDTYMDAWKRIPPHRPAILSSFLGKITRHLAIDRWRKRIAEKRGSGEMELALEELTDCISSSDEPQQEMEAKELEALIRRFLQIVPNTSRIIFLKRYWALESIQMIAAEMGLSIPKVKSSLHRTRMKLRKFLNEEGYYVYS